MTIVLARNLEPFETANAVLDMDTHRGQVADSLEPVSIAHRGVCDGSLYALLPQGSQKRVFTGARETGTSPRWFRWSSCQRPGLRGWRPSRLES
jgi:hypothetical protein